MFSYKFISIKAFKNILLFSLSLMFILPNTFSYANNLNELKENLLEIIKNKHATIGIAIISNGDSILTINNNIHYPLMSVFKFHQAIALSNYLAKNGIPLSSTIHIKKSDLLGNTYSPLREKHPDGDIYLSIYDLLKYTLQLSDNNACDILFDKFINPINVDSYIKSLGINSFAISKNEKDMHDNLDNCYENWTTPLAAAKLLDIFLTADIMPSCYLNSIKTIMVECETGQERLKKNLPLDKIIIGHKTGTGDKNTRGEIIGLNDIGFVLIPNGKRYTIAVLIKNSSESFQATEKIIADISLMVFNYMTNNNN